MKKLVYCSFSFEGFHFWSQAPEEVGFLREKHRHLFFVKAYKEVSHSNRDIEFIILGRRIKDYILRKFPNYNGIERTVDLGETSCEMLAESLINEFGLHSCEVSEDLENGSIVFRENIYK